MLRRHHPGSLKFGDSLKFDAWSLEFRASAYQLIEALVYIGLLLVVFTVGYAALYRCIDATVAMRRGAEDLSRSLYAGERWRADVRASDGPPRLEATAAGQILHLPAGMRGELAYRFDENAVFRRVGSSPWSLLLTNVVASTMEPEPRQHASAWRWELELRPRMKASRIRPLFTFKAVSGASQPK